jgi:hypothetical protein
MTSVSFSHDALIPSAYLVEIATSGALDEISNAPGSVRQYIRSQGLIQDGVTHKGLFFAIYQTGRHGPQNGFRLCIVHEGFEVGEEDKNTRGRGDAVRKAEEPIMQGAIEFVRLGPDRGIDNSV